MTAKRLFDVAVAAFALVLLAPVLALVALAVLGTFGRPVLFRQVRPGLGGRPFVLRKFRTLHPPAVPGDEVTDESPDRETRLGRFLRASGLDELPELLNVLAGEMSLVGPRPLLMEYLPRYSDTQARRHEVRPGLTGLSQISGESDWGIRLGLDVRYVDEHSLALDLRILTRTAGVLLHRSGGHTGVLFPGSG